MDCAEAVLLRTVKNDRLKYLLCTAKANRQLAGDFVSRQLVSNHMQTGQEVQLFLGSIVVSIKST
jgi:hypothetical protein